MLHIIFPVWVPITLRDMMPLTQLLADDTYLIVYYVMQFYFWWDNLK